MTKKSQYSELGGYVTSPKMFIGRNNNIDENGLMSQKIFGPVKSFRCLCGRLSMSLDRGKTCSFCKVCCDSKELRVTTFGKIKLIFPIIKLNKIKKIKKIFKNSIDSIIDPIFVDSTTSDKKYLAISGSGEEVSIVDSFNTKNRSIYILPLRITGIYSLVLCLKYIINNFLDDIEIAKKIKKLFDDNVISYEIKVIPPEIRPAIVDPKKKNTIRVTPINKHYTSLLQLNKSNNIIKSNIEIDEENWLEMININFREQNNEEIVDFGILEYDKITARYQYYSNLVYESIYDLVSKKEGFIRSLILSRTIEFSARTVIRVDPSIKPYQVKVSRKILFKLWKLHFIYFLTAIKGYEYDYCFENIVPKQYEEVKELFNEFLEWFCSE